jgi:NAD(P)H-hydrate epimerase
MGIAVKADVTISFIGLKAGLMTNDGPEYRGQLVYSDLEVPEDVYTKVTPVANRIDMTGLAGGMTKRHKNSHKGRYGHVLIVGGDYGYPGAIRIAAEASLRAGAGLVSVATRPEYASMIPMTLPEVMATAITSPTDLNPLLATASVVAIGPGLGQDEWGMNLLSKVVESGLPMVVDADALNLIAMEKFACSRWVLTPHPGEAGRLTGSNSDDVQQDRLNACQNLQNVYDGVVVLKGCGTVICDQDQNLTICTDGNPGMASGGMGDCLTGVIAGLLAQGLSLDMAAKLGVCIHAAAADKAALDGERGLMASDLMPWIRHFANH